MKPRIVGHFRTPGQWAIHANDDSMWAVPEEVYLEIECSTDDGRTSRHLQAVQGLLSEDITDEALKRSYGDINAPPEEEDVEIPEAPAYSCLGYEKAGSAEEALELFRSRQLLPDSSSFTT